MGGYDANWDSWHKARKGEKRHY